MARVQRAWILLHFTSLGPMPDRGGHDAHRRFLLKHVHEIDDIADKTVAELRLLEGRQALVTVPPRMLTLLAFQACLVAQGHAFAQSIWRCLKSSKSL